MKKTTQLIFITLAISSLSLADDVNSLRWIGQSYPPYSYSENGVNSGIAIEKLAKILKNTGSSKTTKDIEIKTFSKIFVKMNNDKNTVFFPLARLPERESMFKWVGPIFTDQPVLFAKSNITISSPADLKAYTIGGREGYPGVKQIEALGVSNIQFADSDEQNIQKLKNDQLNMVLCDSLSGTNLMKKLGMKAQDYKVVYVLKSSDMYFAFNKDTDDAIVTAVASALAKK